MVGTHIEPVHTEAQELASAERERITALWDAYKETGAVLVARDGEHLESGTADAADAVTGATKADNAAWEALVNERCHTLGGLLVKMSAVKSAVAESDFQGPPEVLFDAIVRDLERLIEEGMTVASPAAAKAETSGDSATIPDNKTVTTRGLDPVAQIGRDLATTWRQVWRNDEEPLPADAPAVQRNHRERLNPHLADLIAALEAMAPEIQAGTLEGAMVQIMLTHAEADVMGASTEESSEAQMRTISKLLYSALAAIERVAGVPREEVAGEAYMRRDLDPHALVAGGEAEGTA